MGGRYTVSLIEVKGFDEDKYSYSFFRELAAGVSQLFDSWKSTSELFAEKVPFGVARQTGYAR